jgi:hypothetical protein
VHDSVCNFWALPDDGLADLKLAADVVSVDQPVPPLQGRQLRSW